MRVLALLAAVLLLNGSVLAQTGPGGVGNKDGTGGQPQNVLWLRGDAGVSSSGGVVDTWADQSGNLNNATGTGGTRPSYTASDANFNSLPSLNFLAAPAATNYNLTVLDDDNLDNTSNLTVIYVIRPINVAANLGIISKRVNSTTDISYFLYQTGASSRAGTQVVGNSVNSGTLVNNTVFINSSVVTGTTIAPFLSGTAQTTGTGPATIPNTSSNLYIGSFDVAAGQQSNFEGQIAEVIIYKTNISVAQRQIVENYLSAKYNVTIAGDVYTGDNNTAALNFDLDVIGIGIQSGAAHNEGSAKGLVLAPANGTLDVNGEFLLAGHKSATNTVTNANVGTGVQQRWSRTWYIDKTTAGTLDAFVSFDFSDGIGGNFPQNKNNYQLLRLNGATYDVVTVANADKSILGDRIIFKVPNADLVDGVYTLGTSDNTLSPVAGVSNRTWYSYQSGNWSNPLSWTLDGGVFPLYVNTSNEVPGITDNVIITSGRTITTDINNIQINSIQVDGTLDVANSTGHNFLAISGTGTIRMAGNGGVDNFPAGTTTDFADPSIGGRVEVYGSTISLNQARTFNHMVINMDITATIATLMNNITLNGNLSINNGVLRFNDNSSTTSKNLTVQGNVTVLSTAGIQVGTATARHEFNMYGDFNNDGGTVAFTNLASANTASEATNGIVDANFLSASRDQTVICNGPTKFYRIEIAKGVDATYKATITASSAANFSLFGYADQDHGSVAQLVTNDNALGLITGTVELGTNITIPVLSTASNYNVSAGAQLWVNGGTLNKDAGNAIVPYGKVRLSSGILTSRVNSGITTRDNGTIIVEGGTMVVNTIRTSVQGVGNVGGYIQSGGAVTIDGGGPGGATADYYVFSLTYTGNVFNMSGGTLTVKGARSGTAGTRGAIFINSDPANVSVTGGTVIMEISNNNVYKVTSRVAFWNVIMQRTAGTATVVELNGGQSGETPGATEVTLTGQPLVVLNDLTVNSPVNFTTNNNDVTFGGSLDIKSGAAYTHGTNTTTVNGVGVSSITIGNTGAAQTFNNLTINRSLSTAIVRVMNGNATTALRVQGALRVENGILDYNTFVISAQGSIYNAGTIGASASTGKLLLDGTLSQTFTSVATATNYNMDINNTAGVSLSGDDMVISRTLTLTNGVFNIGTFKLTLQGSAASIAPATFSTTRMIQTAGNTSDGGLEMFFDSNETIDFPIGTNANATVRYTPAKVATQTISGTGYIRITPSDMILQTTNLAGSANVLTYFWRASTRLLGASTTLSYQFTYAQSDVQGTETNYLPGKVLSAGAFTRSAEVASDINTTTNVLTFNGTSINSSFAGNGFLLEQADYTAGDANRFTGAPRVIYTRFYTADGWNSDWRVNTNWTLGTNGAFNVHDSRQTSLTAGDYPKAGDVAVIGYVPFTDPATADRGKPHGVAVNQVETVAELRFTTMLNSSGNPTARVYASNFQFRPTVVINNNGGTPGSFAGGVVSGEGGFWIRSTGGNLSDPTWNNVDLGAFNAQDSSYMIYESTLANATYVNMPSTFPNLLMTTDNWGDNDKNSTINRTILVNNDMELLGDINLILPTGAVGDITVMKNLRYFRSNAKGNDSGGGGEIRFGNTGTARTITIYGNWEMGNGYAALASIPSPGTTPLTHTINLYGSYLQNTTAGNGFKGGTNTAQDRIHMNLLGSTSAVVNNAGGDAPQFHSLTVNKGTSIATTATFNAAFTLSGLTNAPAKALTLTNGLMIINNGTTNINLTTGGGDFSIPSTAGLEVRLGTVNVSGANTGILLDGLLLVSGGTVNMDGGAGVNNYIEYSASGNATLTVTAGTLTVGSQVRRNLTNTAGILKYNQSGGTVVIAKRTAPSTIRGVFEVINTGSSFTHTGGSFTIVQGINSTTVPSLLLEPATSSVTSGSTITIGNADTPSGANSQNIGIKATVPIYNLTIAGVNNPIAKIYITPLTLAGTLLVNTNAKFNANGQGLNIGINMQVDGGFIASGNTTTFTGTGVISGSTPSLEFYNLIKNGTGTITQSRNINVDKDLSIQSGGTIAGGLFALNLKGNAQITGNHTSTSGASVVGLNFTGTTQQQLTRSNAGTSQLGVVTTSNAAGIIIPDGNNYNYTINNGLRMSQGVFDIGGSLLTLTTNAFITPVNPFSVTNMIQTNSSFTDKGVKKIFPTGYTTDFTYPVGQLAYTPVRFNFATSGNTTGTTGTPTITVRPANERHPSVIEDSESPDPEIVDASNVLQYHWIINADNVASTFRSDMILSYVESLVAVTAPYTEADYIAARILSDANPTNAIDKFSTSDVNETTNTITFSFSGLTDAGMSGDYFAGVDTAIPDNIRTFTTVRTGTVNEGSFPGGVYDNAVPGGGAPRGAVLVVENGHTLTFNVSNVSLYRTEIKAGGVLIIPTGSIGHRLGTLTGEGTLRIESNTASAVLPAAVYDDFFSCTGGTLTYAGTGSYDVLGGITTVRNLVLEGSTAASTSVKTLANNDIFICDDLVLNGGGFRNDINNRSITVGDDFILTESNSTGFRPGVGTVNIGGDYTQASGIFLGSTGGNKTVGNDFILTGGTFTPGSGGYMAVRRNMNYSGGTFNGGSSTFKFVFDGTGVTQVITGDFTASSRFHRFEINNSNNVSLNGNVDIFQELIFTTGRIIPNTSLLTLSTTATATPTEGKVNSYVAGRLYKQMTAGSTFIFPIGSSSLWRYGSVNVPSGGTRTWYMEYIYAPPTSNPLVDNLTGCSSTILRISAGEHWKVGDDGAAGLSARVGLSWGIESDVSAVLSEREALQVMVWNDGTSCWNERGGTSFMAGHTQSRGYFVSNTAIAFSENIVTLGSTEVANPLPVTWVSFEGRTSGGMNLLTWKTASEMGSSHFDLLHSTDGETYTKIGTVTAQGNTTEETVYNFAHNNPSVGNNYYKLQQFDFNGDSDYYPGIVVLKNEASDAGLSFVMYPNPTQRKEVTVEISKGNNYPVKVRLTDLAGRVVFEDFVASESLSNVYKVKFDQSVAKGLYLIEISQGGRRVVKRLVID